MCEYEFDTEKDVNGYLVPKLCKDEFYTGNGMSVVIWSEKCASRNLILEIVFCISYLVPKIGKYEFDTEKGISMVIWSQKCANMNLILEMVCQ